MKCTPSSLRTATFREVANAIAIDHSSLFQANPLVKKILSETMPIKRICGRFAHLLRTLP